MMGAKCPSLRIFLEKREQSLAKRAENEDI
jgi:hypothetical protein